MPTWMRSVEPDELDDGAVGNADGAVVVEILLEAGLLKFQREAAGRYPDAAAEFVGEIVAAAVGDPDPIGVVDAVFPRHLVSGRGLLDAHGRILAAELGHRDGGAPVLKLDAAPRRCRRGNNCCPTGRGGSTRRLQHRRIGEPGLDIELRAVVESSHSIRSSGSLQFCIVIVSASWSMVALGWAGSRMPIIRSLPDVWTIRSASEMPGPKVSISLPPLTWPAAVTRRGRRWCPARRRGRTRRCHRRRRPPRCRCRCRRAGGRCRCRRRGCRCRRRRR